MAKRTSERNGPRRRSAASKQPAKRAPSRSRRAVAIGEVTARAVAEMPPPERISFSPPPRTAASLTVKSGANPNAQTVIYVHGIGNKPVASVLKCQWDRALFGKDLGDRTRMAYWVNRQYYPMPEAATCGDKDLVEVDDDEISTSSIMSLAASTAGEDAEREAVDREVQALAQSPAQAAFLRSIEIKMSAAEAANPADLGAMRVGAKILPLPGFLRRIVVRHLTRAFLRDVNDFFFSADRRKAMTDSLVERLSAGGGPFVIVAHSQGTMIAYEVLRHLSREQVQVPLFVTIGSPLALQEVQDVFRAWTGKSPLEPPACVARWVNVADRLDPVALDTDISNDFGGEPNVENHDGFINPDSPRHPHSGTGYLATKPVQTAVLATLSNAFSQAVGQFVISRDLAEQFEDSRPNETRRTLVQLNTQDWKPGEEAPVQDLNAVGNDLMKHIQALGTTNPVPGRGEPERLKRFIVADLTRHEVETLRTLHRELEIDHIWANAVKRATIVQSTHTVQARPANLGYGATGRGIGWAVLDTGIKGDHPHFEKFKNIGPQWDCVQPGKPAPLPPGTPASNQLDKHGHGTHVAATIGGALQVQTRAARPDEPLEQVPRVDFAGMAPEATLYGFKVLDDDGNGQDSYIIKALDTIADLNENAARLIIHGVNLSLGGNFDPRAYGCGHTPLCQELRRLWRQGVVVCLAAGNEGWALVQEEGGLVPTNRDISIGDPANLEEAIAVGSVHKENPHTYGISYFSSRGPTADGRQKPDLVAPGERIVSAYNRWTSGQSGQHVRDDLYIEMSGTSMATPHVSGILAAFLSIRREFIGYPDRLKMMLLKGCTDLGRDRYMQGAGMPNLIRMLTDS